MIEYEMPEAAHQGSDSSSVERQGPGKICNNNNDSSGASARGSAVTAGAGAAAAGNSRRRRNQCRQQRQVGAEGREEGPEGGGLPVPPEVISLVLLCADGATLAQASCVSKVRENVV